VSGVHVLSGFDVDQECTALLGGSVTGVCLTHLLCNRGLLPGRTTIPGVSQRDRDGSNSPQ